MAAAVQRLPLEELRSTIVAPAVTPLPTAVALIAHVLRGALPELRGDLLAVLRRRDVEALMPLRTTEPGNGGGGRPNEIVPRLPSASLENQLELVAEVDPEVLAEGIVVAGRAGHPTAPFEHVAREPALWLHHYIQAVRRAWTALEPLWRRSAGTLDREVERVSVALARGAASELIAECFPYAGVAEDALELPTHASAAGALHTNGVPAHGDAARPVRTGDVLVLQPLVAPTTAAGWTDDYGDVCLAVRYAVPQERLDAAGPPPASLEALVGSQRALILTRLERPAGAGKLAELLHGVPSIASHHLRALERAGLVTRVREGRRVTVRRTARGSELVALYSESR
jgi:DNA-binding transcriptional ArsR family regulator